MAPNRQPVRQSFMSIAPVLDRRRLRILTNLVYRCNKTLHCRVAFRSRKQIIESWCSNDATHDSLIVSKEYEACILIISRGVRNRSPSSSIVGIKKMLQARSCVDNHTCRRNSRNSQRERSTCEAHESWRSHVVLSNTCLGKFPRKWRLHGSSCGPCDGDWGKRSTPERNQVERKIAS